VARHSGKEARDQIVIVVVALIWMLLRTDAGNRIAGAQEQTVEQLEAAVVMTLARFVEWSAQEFPSASAAIVIAIVADEEVAIALETNSRGKNVAGRTIAVKRLQWDSDFAGVHMLFIGDAERRHVGVVLDRIRSRPIVTVSHLADFARTGGMITVTTTEGRISFAVNSRATAQSGVRLSSFLLSHATKVSHESGGDVR